MKELWIDIFPYWEHRNSILVAFLVSIKFHRLYMQLMKKKYMLCWCSVNMGKNIIYFIYSSSAFFWWRYICILFVLNWCRQVNFGEEKLLQNSDEGVLMQSSILHNGVVNFYLKKFYTLKYLRTTHLICIFPSLHFIQEQRFKEVKRWTEVTPRK